MLLRYFLIDFEMDPLDPIITGITFVFAFIPHLLYFYCRSLYFMIFSASFLITFLSPDITSSNNVHVPFHYHTL